jgi:hypothetical protein
LIVAHHRLHQQRHLRDLYRCGASHDEELLAALTRVGFEALLRRRGAYP